jgi:hypothetical protein
MRVPPPEARGKSRPVGIAETKGRVAAELILLLPSDQAIGIVKSYGQKLVTG